MQVSKKYLSIIGASLMHSLLLANPDVNGPLVQRDDSDRICINPFMTTDVIDDLHQLIKRSYRITNRGDNKYDYLYPHKLINRRCNRMLHRSFSSDGLAQESFTNTWFIHQPFSGTHGALSLGGLVGKIVAGDIETDYQGFVAYLPAAPDRNRPPIVAIVYRGSQAKSFQKLNGIFGPSWLTNFSAKKAKMDIPMVITGYPILANIEGTVFHEGFLAKYLSARYSVLADIEDVWGTIPEDLKSETRFIVTGHSQGAGVAIPAALDIVNTIGKRYFGEYFNNIETPRFFVYALSGPNPVGDLNTKEKMHTIIGRDNIIRHNSLFDIVTFACLGTKYDKWIYNMLFKGVAGVETGYHPVGHLAIDDVKVLFEKGLRYNQKDRILENMDKVWNTWSRFYSETIKGRQAKSHIECFYHAIKKICKGIRGVKSMDGVYSFVTINHYGSSTANTDCLPIEDSKIRKSRVKSAIFDFVGLKNSGNSDLQSKRGFFGSKIKGNEVLGLKVRDHSDLKTSFFIDEKVKEKHEDHSLKVRDHSDLKASFFREVKEKEVKEKNGTSFDPRLPEIDLNPCLIRGENHRNLIFNLIDFKDPGQVFDPSLVEDPDSILTGYESDEYVPEDQAREENSSEDSEDKEYSEEYDFRKFDSSHY